MNITKILNQNRWSKKIQEFLTKHLNTESRHLKQQELKKKLKTKLADAKTKKRKTQRGVSMGKIKTIEIVVKAKGKEKEVWLDGVLYEKAVITVPSNDIEVITPETVAQPQPIPQTTPIQPPLPPQPQVQTNVMSAIPLPPQVLATPQLPQTMAIPQPVQQMVAPQPTAIPQTIVAPQPTAMPQPMTMPQIPQPMTAPQPTTIPQPMVTPQPTQPTHTNDLLPSVMYALQIGTNEAIITTTLTKKVGAAKATEILNTAKTQMNNNGTPQIINLNTLGQPTTPQPTQITELKI